MANDGFIQVAPDGAGKKMDTSEIVVGANTVERERIVLSDDADPAGLAPTRAVAPAATDYGTHVRHVPRNTEGDVVAVTAGETPLASVNETPESYVTGQVRPLSLTTEGRLRVASRQAMDDLEFFRIDGPMAFDVPHLTATASADLWAIGANSPWP